MKRLPALLSLSLLSFCLHTTTALAETPLQVSGIYPSLTAYNGLGECGIGATVPWAGRLWWITYPPHFTKGSTDKLYSVGPEMNDLTIHAESVGGTHACRMIHKESNQLIIGVYFISAEGKIRAVDVKNKLIGRMTAIARHLTDPANLVYFYDMEGQVYEVNVHTLDVKRLFKKPVPGWHGKGGYTSQGRLVVSNNGEAEVGKGKPEYLAKLPPPSKEDAGVLAEWDGQEWRIVERHQFLDVTGPGGIHGAPDDKSPLWAIGWDKRSLILKFLDGGTWSTYRLPKGSYAFDPKHGWYTEWPRIRDLDDGKFLAVLHGQMFDFPGTFSKGNTAGIRPVATHLRYVPDLTSWGDKLVIASDDTSIMRNPLAGQSQSNLWFGTQDELKTWGATIAWGGVWMGDKVKTTVPSDPMMISGYAKRGVHLSHRATEPVTFTLQVDAKGDGTWTDSEKVTVPAQSYLWHPLPADLSAEWMRIVTDKDCQVTAYFSLCNDSPHPLVSNPLGEPLTKSVLIRPAGKTRNLQVQTAEGYHEVDEKLGFISKEAPQEAKDIQPKWQIKADCTIDSASVFVTDHEGKRWRLPKTDAAYDASLERMRGLREIQSERFMGNWHGTFYEIPRAHVGGDSDRPDYLKMKPVTTHRQSISDYCTWRGLLVLSGGAAVPDTGKVVTSPDGKTSLWFGMSDDLWKMGRPAGHGGPWKDTAVKAGLPSDPYLMTNYQEKTITLSHAAPAPVKMTVQVDFLATGIWRNYQSFTVPAGEKVSHTFPDGYQAHWLRVVSDQDCQATAQCEYR